MVTIDLTVDDRQPREHPVPCPSHSVRRTRNGARPRIMTWNVSGICTACEVAAIKAALDSE